VGYGWVAIVYVAALPDLVALLLTFVVVPAFGLNSFVVAQRGWPDAPIVLYGYPFTGNVVT